MNIRIIKYLLYGAISFCVASPGYTAENTPAASLICGQCSAKNLGGSKFCNQCATQIGQASPPKQAADLMAQGNSGAAIALLPPYCMDNPSDADAKILYAEALIKKCEHLKEAGDKEYQELILKPFQIGKRLIVQHRYEAKYLAQGCYICARSYWVNDRSGKAVKYMQKAIDTAPALNINYYFLLADMSGEIAIKEYNTLSWASKHRNPNAHHYITAKKRFRVLIDIAPDDQTKAESYYKFGLFLTEMDKDIDARKAFEAALSFTEDEELERKITCRTGI